MYVIGIGLYTGDLTDKQKRLKFLKEINHPREDKSIVSDVTAECLKSAKIAFNMLNSSFPKSDKDNCYVYTSCELEPHSILYLYDFIINNLNFENSSLDEASINEIWNKLGNYRDRIHPLLAFEKLITSTVYHLSKHFGLKGEGYPISNMSMSGITMLEQLNTNYSITNASKALLCSYGDMNLPVYKGLFKTLGLFHKNEKKENKLGKASASLVIEKELQYGFSLGKVLEVRSRYFSRNYISFSDWMNFYEDHFKNYIKENPIVVSYGTKDTHKTEYMAVQSFFNPKRIVAYRNVYGYTGPSNTFVNMFCILNDKEIPEGSVLIINCMGLFSGIGSLAFLKERNIS